MKKQKPIKTAKSKSAPEPEEVSLTCACNRDVTATELGKIFRAQKKKTIEKFISDLNKTMSSHGITSCLQKSHFLSQVGHESGQLTYVAEVLAKGVKEKDVYDGYKGRGLIQITYKSNYEAYGNHVSHDFTGDHKVDLENTKWASDSAGWYWSVMQNPSLNQYADKNDLIYISQAINGAFNGFDDRKMLLGRSAEALLLDRCPNQTKCWDMDNFSLCDSEANNIAAAAFAWGLWHDPDSTKSGTPKNVEQSLIGYKRFIELKDKQKKGRFGFKTAEKMIEHAEKRVKVL